MSMKAQSMAGHLIRRLYQVSNHTFSQQMQAAGHDLTSVQFAALDAIIAHPGLDQAGVAARIGYDRATIGGVIDRLERKGLVSRRVAERDRRAREVFVTEPGRALFDRCLPVVTALQDDILGALDDGERAAFMALARKVVIGEE